MSSGGQHAKDHTASSSRHHHLNQQHHHAQGSHHSTSSAHHYSNHTGHNSKASGQGGRSASNVSSSGAINKMTGGMTVGQALNHSREQARIHQQLLAVATAASGGQGKNALVPDLSQLKPVNLQDPKNLPPGLPADLVKLMNKSTGLAATTAPASKNQFR